MALLLTLAICLILVKCLHALLAHLKTRDALEKVHQPRGYPLLGHGLIAKPDPEGFVNQIFGMGYLYPSAPRACVLWLGPMPITVIYSAELLEKIVCNSNHLNKGFAYKLLEPWLGQSLLISKKDRWRPKRKLLTPTFHYDILKDFVPVFNEQAKILVQKMGAACGKGKGTASTSGKVEVLELVTLCMLDIICETSMGRSVNAQMQKDSEYVWAVHTINKCVSERTRNPFTWPEPIYKLTSNGRTHSRCIQLLHSFTRQVIDERAAELERSDWKLGDGDRMAFLDLLLLMAHRGQMDPKDIQEEVDTFMFEGHDTTSNGLAWTLHFLGCNKHVQIRAQKEVDEVLQGSEEGTVEHISQLKYVECCLKEALRLCPSVPMILRELGADQPIAEDVVLPRGTHVLLNLFLVHRDPSQWPQPETFNPDRFLPENSIGRHPFAFAPFSAGSRNCIGQRFAIMEEKVVLAHILRNFTITSLQKRHEIRTDVNLIMRPQEGLFVKLEPRNKLS
ncbi:hypothetical protein WR25_07696 [Diploscapter pachys]|uniref:Cytochrome P450 n=1 Tax=Diploscapter pachys TaxID=2018661 RepID=A0A2A2JP93_9BILA|nr:hypothetical protein WR25_07696 [Diploscapter pachys]